MVLLKGTVVRSLVADLGIGSVVNGNSCVLRCPDGELAAVLVQVPVGYCVSCDLFQSLPPACAPRGNANQFLRSKRQDVRDILKAKKMLRKKLYCILCSAQYYYAKK
jgi:hypothetical protein